MGLYADLGLAELVLRVVVSDDPQWLSDTLGGTWLETSETTAQTQGAGPGLYYSSFSPPLFIPVWSQPTGSTDAYPNAQWVWHNGSAWRSLTPANVWEPGVAAWREELTEWPEWVQPTGSSDAYQIGEKITFQSQHYISLIDANVWSPTGYPAGWELQP